MDNYIAGSRIDNLFKRYENMGTALLSGFEADLNYYITPQWMAGASASWVLGRHNHFNEPLPMIPPLKGSFSVQRESEKVSLESRLRWAAAQNRIAEQNSLETPTGGYVLWDLFAKTELTRNLVLTVGAENLLNRFYTDHLSVNDMPGAGRNIQAGLRVLF
jgi:iron complex outermembrane recepter protein